jgi:hypothetical protein
MATINTADFAPVALGISGTIREENRRDGSPVMVSYIRTELADPGAVPCKLSEKGNTTVATVGQNAPLQAIRFPSGRAMFPKLSFSIWGKVEE